MRKVQNGMSAALLTDVRWRKSSRSGARGNCVELAELPDGGFAIRNSRCPNGPALVYSRNQLSAFLSGTKNDSFLS